MLAGLSEQEVDARVRADLERLQAVIAGVDDLRVRSQALRATVQAKLEAEARDHYLPTEGDQIRSLFASFLSYRTALLRILATYRGYARIQDSGTQARCFLVGFASAMRIFESSLRVVAAYRNDALARSKLDEPEPAWGIPPDMFSSIYHNVGNSWNIRTAEEFAAYFELHRDAWRRDRVWPPETFDWLAASIDGSLDYVREHSIPPHQAWFDDVSSRLSDGAYRPVYAIQAAVGAWLGDTRLTSRPHFVTIRNILDIERFLMPGDILLERRNWYLSNAILPGFWSHAALYVGRVEDLERLGIADRPAVQAHLAAYRAKAKDGQDHTVIEAVSEGVILSSVTHSMHADYVAVLRPRLSKAQIGEAIARAFSHVGKPYDFEFDFATNDKLVCTELLYRAYQGALDFTPLPKLLGRRTLPANELARKFVRERYRADRDLDFVLFLDRVPGENRARFAQEEEFCFAAERSRSSFGE
jgi:hypothetical protein